MKKKQTRPPKFDYQSSAFLNEIESMAAKGYTDKDIAYGLVVKFGESLTPQHFKDLKNGRGEDGEETEVSREISAALTRGRASINLAVRSTYLKLALGGKVVSSTTRRKLITAEGNETESDVIQTTETELPPNLQALSTWLFNHDDEWREKTLEGKKLDITTGGGNSIAPRKVEINVVYNKKEDLEMQTRTDTDTKTE